MASKDLSQTIRFGVAAGVSLLIAGAAYWVNLPPRVTGFELVGHSFFDQFQEVNQAASLDVFALDANARMQQFSVKKIDDVWCIPSHHNYPAEAADRLAKVGASVIRLNREALVGRLPAEHARFGVLDPQDETQLELENTGKRLVLRDVHGGLLADLIIGHRVSDDDLPTQDRNIDPSQRDKPRSAYYVRRTDEQQTYRVHLDLDLSTRFSDWIDSRLLNVSSGEINKLFLDNYELRERVNPTRQTIEIAKYPGEQIELIRPQDPWKWQLVGLDESAGTLDETKVNQLLRTLTGLTIVGVRPKYLFQGQQFLSADLTPIRLPEFEARPELFEQAFELLRRNLRDKGFNLLPRSNRLDEFQFVSQFGEFAFSTSDGVGYRVYLGRSISGDDNVIEFGGDSDESLPPATPAGTDEDAAQQETPAEPPADKDAKNRFLMITVHVDESALGPAPEMPNAPEEPTRPEGYLPADETDLAEAAQQDEQSDNTQQDAQQTPPPRNPAFIEYEKAMAEFELAQMQFEMAKMRYESEIESRQRQLADARSRVDQYNDRFGAWYYVVSADNLASLRVTQAELVKPVDPRQDDGDGLV
ncbi:MAG TPA: DUF4340 domain-containing protein, partial [Pirellulaceae bacterium]|nr:DUF4340 domain-containing protein [Pirellulaceae bacterium]